MIKTKIIETTEKYDKDGKLVEKITREETSEDDEKRVWRATSPWATEPFDIPTSPLNTPCPNIIPCCGRKSETINITY